MASVSASSPSLQESGMLAREQLIHLFDRFAFLTSQADVKRRIKEAVNDNQEAVAVTTTIQEEILTEMGIDPRFGIAFLGKVNAIYENDRDLMIQFYRFVAKEELACDEAELDPDEFSGKMLSHQKLQEQQLEMLKYMRRFHPDDQSVILETLRRQMEGSNFGGGAAVLSSKQIEEIVRSRAAPSPRDPRREAMCTDMEMGSKVYPWSRRTAFAAAASPPPMSLMPAAILAMTLGLGADDREGLARLVERSLQAPAAGAGAGAGAKGRRRHHRRRSVCDALRSLRRVVEGFEAQIAPARGFRRPEMGGAAAAAAAGAGVEMAAAPTG